MIVNNQLKLPNFLSFYQNSPTFGELEIDAIVEACLKRLELLNEVELESSIIDEDNE